MRYATILLAAFFLGPLPSSAEDTGDFMTAAQLAARCNTIGVKGLTPYQEHEATLALGYIWGVIAGSDAPYPGNKAAFCAPPIDAYQACKVLNAWLEDNSDAQEKSAALELLTSLRHAYPCAD